MPSPPYSPHSSEIERLRDKTASETFLSIEKLIESAPDPVASILGYLLEHLYDPRPLSMIRRGLQASPEALRDFERLTGQEFDTFFVAKRLEIARALLIESNCLLRDIAFVLGFRTPGAFTAEFRKHFGIAPSRFRTREAGRKARRRPESTGTMGSEEHARDPWSNLLDLGDQEARDLIFTLLDRYLPGEGEP